MKDEKQLNGQSADRAVGPVAVVSKPIFGKPIFGVPAGRTVSTQWGRTSCVMLDVLVPIIGSGLSFKTAIYANLERKPDGLEVVPSAYVPKKFIQPMDEGALETLQAHIETAALAWPGYDTAFDQTAKALLGHADPANKALGVASRPKLGRLIKPGEQSAANAAQRAAAVA